LRAAFGFANAKAPGYEADDFLAAAVAADERTQTEMLRLYRLIATMDAKAPLAFLAD
jgi:hypothetical protein